MIEHAATLDRHERGSLDMLSVIAPVLNEEENLIEFHSALVEALPRDLNWELILIDDGSTDDTLNVLTGICERDKRVSGLSLSRNFGHQIALTAGYQAAEGQVVVSMDSDLQHPAQVIPEMIDRWREGADIVVARRGNRSGGFVLGSFYRLFLALMRRVSSIDLIEGASDFCLMDRKAVDSLNQYGESSRFIRGMVCDLGFRQEIVDYEQRPRTTGKSRWNFWSLSKFGVSGVISFSAFPLRISFFFGLILSLLSIGYAGWIIAAKLMYSAAPAGLPSTLVGIFFLGGIQLISIGIVGEYLARIFLEVKGRPLYLISEVVGTRAETTDLPS